MLSNDLLRRLSTKELLILLIVLILGVGYVFFIRKDSLEQQKEKALLIARSVEASLSDDFLKTIPENPDELKSLDFPDLRKSLQKIIAQNKSARFGYIYIERNSKLYFIADSESENSSDYSPTGQEFTEADPHDFIPFQSGKPQITEPVTDRWGTWVSAEVPIKDKDNRVVAVLGMDYDASSWRIRIWGEIIESILLVIFIFALVVAYIRNIQKNKALREEIKLRETIELQIRKRGSESRLLFELNPQPMLVYDLDSGKILDANQAAVKQYGYNEAEFMNLSIDELQATNNRIPTYRKQNNFHPASEGEIRNHRLKDGRLIQVEVFSHNFDYQRKNAGLLLLLDITENLKIQTELREKQAQLGTLLSNLPGIAYTCALDENYTMEFISDGCTRITGYTPEDFVERKSISFNDLILPEYREPIRNKWEISLNQRSYFEYKYPIRTNSGEIKWIWERGQGIFDQEGELLHLEGYIEEITEQIQAEQQLKKLSRAIEQNPVSIVITDALGNIEYVNPRFTEITGYEAREAIGQNPRILKSGKMDDTFYRELWSTIKSGAVWNGEIINRRKSGELYWASKSISAIFNSQGQILNYVAIGEEITEKKRIEAELILAKEKAEESDRLKTAFLTNISHEIRTPMNGILGFADLLKAPDLTSELKTEFIDIIEKSGQRMLNIINDLIDISKIEAGEIIVRIKPVNVNHMLQEIHLFFMPEINQKTIAFDYHCDLPDDQSIIETDGTKLNQIIVNLVKNALKFTDTGSINFGYTQKDSMLEFFVSDTGLGIEPDQKDLIFERFRQGNISLNRKHEGAGLGLAISKAYVELLGGEITVESELNHGSTFRFTLPLSR